VVLSVIVFKRTVDYQAYKDVVSDYRKALKIGLDHPDFRNPEWTSEYTKKDPKEKLSYEQYASFHNQYEQAILDIKSEFGRQYPLIIDGKKIKIESMFSHISPVDTRITLGYFPI
jgi:predicted solute-binding protein